MTDEHLQRIEKLAVTPAVKAALRASRNELEALYGDRLAQVVLFGSQARGEAGEASDIDILVILKEPVNKHKEIGIVSKITSKVMMETGELVGFVVSGVSRILQSESGFFVNVRREGIVL